MQIDFQMWTIRGSVHECPLLEFRLDCNQRNFAMAFIAQAEAPPLREHVDGTLRVGDSRVLLELVIRAFQDGATPEAIVQRYSTLRLPDVYATIAYYLRHTDEIEAYLNQRERLANEVQARIGDHQSDLSEIRARLLVQRQARG
jgi:uncharacterized protein (DUF433 family)